MPAARVGRRSGRVVVAALGLTVASALAACSPDTPTDPQSSAPPASSSPIAPPSGGPASSSDPSAPSSSSSGTTAPASPDDTVAAASTSAAAYLRDGGYAVTGTTANSVTYTASGPVTVTFTCGGGSTHDVGWVGLCSGRGTNALPMVAPARVVAGPRAEAVAMLREDAAYCGSEDTPAWAKKVLKESSKEFCYLKEGEG